MIDYLQICNEYAREVIDGERISCKWVKLACKRHLKDCKRKDIYFDNEAAAKAIGFMQTFRHYKGDFAGRRFEMMVWQVFIVASIFGWIKKSDGKRRYKYAFIEIPRKNGKTFLAAGIALYMFCADREGGAEIYCAATKKDQAKILWKDMKTLIEKSKNRKFIERFKIRAKPEEIEFPERQAFAVPLGRDKDGASLDGLNPHCVAMDELHAWKSFDYWNVLNSALGARSQPLMLMITTAGYVMQGVGKQQEKIAQNILSGKAKGDDYFGIIHTVDKKDDIFDPKTWEKANPCYGTTVTKAKFESYVELAKQNPDLLREFKVKWLNVWVYQVDSWLDATKWDKCHDPFDEELLKGKYCYGAIDLAQVNDLSAFTLIFPAQEGIDKPIVKNWFWCPADNIVEKANQTGNPYHIWLEQGLLRATLGNVTDYAKIQADIIDLCGSYDVRNIAFDRTFSGQMVNNLVDALGDEILLEYAQTFMRISAPAKELERLVLGGEINHLDHPILNWMAGNAVVAMDNSGNIKPDKARSEDKIDGIVTLVMAVGLMMELDGEAGVTFSEFDVW